MKPKPVEYLIAALEHIAKRDAACSPCAGRCPDIDPADHLQACAAKALKKYAAMKTRAKKS